MFAKKTQATDERLLRWMREHATAVRGFLAARTRNEDAADELLQEVFVRAWQANYRETGEVRGFLLRIADRLVIDRIRRHRREQGLPDEGWDQLAPVAEDDGPAERLDRAEQSHLLKSAVDALSEPQQRVLLLRFYGDLSFAEIAEVAGWPLGTVLSHCRRGLMALRRQLDNSDTMKSLTPRKS